MFPFNVLRVFAAGAPGARRGLAASGPSRATGTAWRCWAALQRICLLQPLIRAPWCLPARPHQVQGFRVSHRRLSSQMRVCVRLHFRPLPWFGSVAGSSILTHDRQCGVSRPGILVAQTGARMPYAWNPHCRREFDKVTPMLVIGSMPKVSAHLPLPCRGRRGYVCAARPGGACLCCGSGGRRQRRRRAEKSSADVDAAGGGGLSPSAAQGPRHCRCQCFHTF